MIIFFKPRVFRLLTDRNTFMTKRCDNLPEANYVVINTDIGTHNQVLPENITTCNPAVKLNPVYTDKSYIVYKIEKVSWAVSSSVQIIFPQKKIFSSFKHS